MDIEVVGVDVEASTIRTLVVVVNKSMVTRITEDNLFDILSPQLSQ